VAAATSIALALALPACGGDEPEETTTAQSGCEEVKAPAPKRLDLAAPKQREPSASGVTFETSCGSFTVTFDDRAPRTAASFQYLAEQGAFDDTVIHRVFTGQLIQGGDPLGADPERAGTGAPGYFVDEPPPSNLAYTQGTVAMAKTTAEPPGRSGSQFLIVTAGDLGLTPDFALVGEVTEGFDVVQAIDALGEDGGDGPPTTTVVVEQASVEE